MKPHLIRRAAARGGEFAAFTRKHAALGWRNALALAAMDGGLRRADVRVRLRGLPHPLTVRFGTADVDVLAQVFLAGGYDVPAPGEVRFVVDAGANVGYTTALFAARYPAARVVALEPESGNFAALRRNTAAYSNVTAMQAGLWNRGARLRIRNAAASSWAFQVEEAGADDANAIRAMSVPDLMREFNAERVDLLKVDIEGAESEVFDADCGAWLGRVGMLMVELHDWLAPECGRRLDKAAAPFDFERSQRGETTVLVRKGMELTADERR